MKLSVMITCYNQVSYIVQAIESVLTQKVNFDYEIIIGDDGSNDGSYELIKEKYSEQPNITLFQMPRTADGENNSSIRASLLRIKLLEYVHGEYFAYLDGDDFYCDDLKFQRQISVLDDPANSDCVCCANNSFFYYEDDHKTPIVPDYVKSGRIAVKDYWYSYWFHASNCLFRSSIIQQLPHEILDKTFHDNVITFWALQYGSLYYDDSVTMCYRQEVNNSIWTTNKEIVRHIRQGIGADICMKLNLKLWFCTYCRNRVSFEYLYNCRNTIPEDLSVYINLARELGCKQTLELVCFREQGKIRKILVRGKHIILCKMAYVNSIRINKKLRKCGKV